MRMKFTFKSLLLAAGLLMGSVNAWADDWNTIWFTDFSTEPTGITYSIQEGTVAIEDGILTYKQSGSGGRSVNATFTDSKFAVTETNWMMEFDWGSSGPNSTNECYVTFSTNKGVAFKITWTNYAADAKITDSNDTELTTTLPSNNIVGRVTDLSLSHFIITGDKDNGIYLTVTNGGNTYVDNVLVSSDFGYPTGMAGNLAKSYSGMYIDNIYFKTPAVVGFVASPAIEVTAPVGIARKFTLSCLTENATIFYSETDLEIETEGWTEYTSEVTTSVETIYAYAKDAEGNTSEKVSFQTGAGVAITLNAPTISVANFVASGAAYNAVFNATYDVNGVEFTPTATLEATFAPENGVASSVQLPYTAKEKGVLTVKSVAEGYTSAESSVNVYASYSQKWQSFDYSSLIGLDAVQVALGEDWKQQDGHGRWASWDQSKDGTYNFYQYKDAPANDITINENIRMRGVVVLAEGMGLGRNVTSGEAISVLNTKSGEIVAFEVYNGYGKDINKGSNTFMSYVLSDGSTNPSMSSTNGALLVQATVYSETPESVSVTISPAGYTTYSSTLALDVTGLSAYYVTSDDLNDDYVTLTEATGTVEANTGLIFKGEANASIEVPVVESGSKLDGNLLVASNGAPVSQGCYVFAYNSSSDDVVSTAGFYKVGNAPAVIPAGKAYLSAGASEAKTLRIVFGDETATAIETVEAENEADGVLYNVAGQLVGNDYKGIVIKNGKKYLNK